MPVVLFLLALAVVFGIYCGIGACFMLLWNFVVPTTFNGPHLSFWVATCGLLLVSFLTGNILRANRK